MEEHEAVKKAANPHAISKGEEGQPDGGGHLAGQAELIPYTNEVVRYEDEQKDADDPRKGVQNSPVLLGQPLCHKFHVNMAAVGRDLGDAEADDHSQGLADDLISAHDRMTEGAQKHIANGQEHHKGEGRSSDMIQELNDPQENAK